MKIAIASGKGGTGKTFVSVNLFESLINKKLNCLLIDCDTEVPNALFFYPTKKEKESKDVFQYQPKVDIEKCLYCGRCADYCEYNAIVVIPENNYIKVLKELCHGCGACGVACKNGAIIDTEVSIGKVNTFSYQSTQLIEGKMKIGNASCVPVIQKAINEGNRYDAKFTILDSPPGTSCPFIQTAAKADYVILVTEPTPFGLSDLKQAVDTLTAMNKPFGIVINRAGIGDKEVYKYINKNHYELLAEIPFDEKIAYLYSKGDIVINHHPQLKEIFNQLGDKIITKWK